MGCCVMGVVGGGAVVGALRGRVGIGRGVATEGVAPGRVVRALAVTVCRRRRGRVERWDGVLVGGVGVGASSGREHVARHAGRSRSR